MSIDSAVTASGRTSARTGALQAGVGLTGLTLEQLRAARNGLGAVVGHAELESALAGRHELDDHGYDLVAQAINDRLVETGLTRMIPQAGEI